MKRNHLWFVLGLVALVGGCALGYTRLAKAPEGRFGTYRIVEVPDLAASDLVPAEVKKEIPDMIVKELSEQKLFEKVERGSGGSGGSILLLKGQVIQYNPGSRGMRYLTGPFWGVGKGSVIVNVKFIDKSSEKELAEATFEGEIKGGLFGGGIDETHEKIAEEIVQFLKSNY